MSGILVRLLCAATLTLAPTIVAVSAAGPAQAVPSMSFVTASTPSDTRLGRTHSAHCPSGRRVLGGGAYVGNGAGEVHVDILRPVTTPTGDSFLANASVANRPDGTSWRGSWFLVVYAICGAAPPGLQYISATSTSGFATTRSATVSCPSGKRVIGAGGQISPAFGTVILDEVAPSTGLTSVRVAAYGGAAPSSLPWRVEAFAVCANPISGLTLASALSPSDSLDKSVTVFCPTGTRIHGLGHDLNGAVGRAGATAVFPSQPLTSATLYASEYLPGFRESWHSRVYAICAG